MAAKKRILVVDDEPEVNEVIRELLELSGFEVQAAYDGAQAIEQMTTFQPDAVVLDVIMPKENGYRVSRQIKTATDSVPPKVILLTGRRLSSYPDREEMFREFSMADAMIYKPIDRVEFIDTIRQLVQN